MPSQHNPKSAAGPLLSQWIGSILVLAPVAVALLGIVLACFFGWPVGLALGMTALLLGWAFSTGQRVLFGYEPILVGDQVSQVIRAWKAGGLKPPEHSRQLRLRHPPDGRKRDPGRDDSSA